MKTKLFLLVILILMAVGCSDPQPEHPITINVVPKSVVKITGQWKMGEFTIGYRIISDEYVIASEGGGLIGQSGAFGGPGMVPYNLVSSFDTIAKIAETVKDKELMTFYGDLIYNRNGDKPYIFENKKVIFLYRATYKERNYNISRGWRYN